MTRTLNMEFLKADERAVSDRAQRRSGGIEPARRYSARRRWRDGQFFARCASALYGLRSRQRSRPAITGIEIAFADKWWVEVEALAGRRAHYTVKYDCRKPASRSGGDLKGGACEVSASLRPHFCVARIETTASAPGTTSSRILHQRRIAHQPRCDDHRAMPWRATPDSFQSRIPKPSCSRHGDGLEAGFQGQRMIGCRRSAPSRSYHMQYSKPELRRRSCAAGSRLDTSHAPCPPCSRRTHWPFFGRWRETGARLPLQEIRNPGPAQSDGFSRVTTAVADRVSLPTIAVTGPP